MAFHGHRHSGGHKGHHLSASTRRKISLANKGKHHGGSSKGSHHRGHPISSATRAKISAALRGRKHPHKGHAMTQATKDRISAALRARHAGSHPTQHGHTKRGASRLGKSHPHHGGHGGTHAPRRPPKTSRRKGVHTAGHGALHHAARRGHTPAHPKRLHHGAVTHHHRTVAHTARHKRMTHKGSLISAHRRRSLVGNVHTRTRHHRHQPVIRRKPRSHRVWRRKRR